MTTTIQTTKTSDGSTLYKVCDFGWMLKDQYIRLFSGKTINNKTYPIIN